MTHLLTVSDLSTEFRTDEGIVRAVDRVDLYLNAGETLGLVGESGCGKSVTSLSIMRLIQPPSGRIVSGRIQFREIDLLSLSDEKMRRVRGRDMAMIFQEPMTSLNPVFSVGDQIAETILIHEQTSTRNARQRAIALLESVAIPDAAKRYGEYPHEMSGGMRQRAMIAMAIACNPCLLIADEPTTALDVTIQAQILELLSSLRRASNLSLLLITHSLGIVAETADRVAVMYAGRIVETADVTSIFTYPLHPYTQGLLRSVPRFDTDRSSRLETIEGMVPSLHDLPPGCAFAPRCPHAGSRCRESANMIMTEPKPGHQVRCVLHQ